MNVKRVMGITPLANVQITANQGQVWGWVGVKVRFRVRVGLALALGLKLRSGCRVRVMVRCVMGVTPLANVQIT